MVTDKLTLSLLSRLADAQLALATAMRGVDSTARGYPEQSLQDISKALEAIEASLLGIESLNLSESLKGSPRLH